MSRQIQTTFKSFRGGNDHLLRKFIDHTLRGYFNRAHGNAPPFFSMVASALVIRGISVAICEVKSANAVSTSHDGPANTFK
jgi:hypothetical protein